MAQVIYPDWQDTIPTQPGEFASAQILEYRKRPYVASGLDQQGLRSVPARIPAGPPAVSIPGVIFIAAIVLCCYGFAMLLHAAFA